MPPASPCLLILPPGHTLQNLCAVGSAAVRVNETDAFGEDEDRDEYFDFEDVSEI